MSAAFAQFDEPLAWLIRGLAEYGFEDLSSGSSATPGILGGFDLRFAAQSQARSGLMLHVPAVADGTRCEQDDSYAFEIYLTDQPTGQGFTVRCAECNFLSDFAFDPANPLWTAGYVHQSISEYVPEFVRWRLSGGELTWAQRQGIPDVVGEPCSTSLATWITQQVSSRQHFDGRHWGEGRMEAAAAAPLAPTGPIAMEGNLGRPDGTANNPVAIARAKMKGPTQAIMVAIAAGALCVAGAMLNILVTVAVFGLDRPFALFSSFVVVGFVSSGAVGAWYGLKHLEQMKESPLAWVAIAFPALIPVCCFAGLPVSIWAGMRWQSPAVRALRSRS
jgi:hypothetical protein